MFLLLVDATKNWNINATNSNESTTIIFTIISTKKMNLVKTSFFPWGKELINFYGKCNEFYEKFGKFMMTHK